MQTTPLPNLASSPIFMIDAHSAESNGKSIFRFLFFEVMTVRIYNFTLTHRTFQCVTELKQKDRLKVVKFTGKVRNMLKQMKNQLSDF